MVVASELLNLAQLPRLRKRLLCAHRSHGYYRTWFVTPTRKTILEGMCVYLSIESLPGPWYDSGNWKEVCSRLDLLSVLCCPTQKARAGSWYRTLTSALKSRRTPTWSMAYRDIRELTLRLLMSYIYMEHLFLMFQIGRASCRERV